MRHIILPALAAVALAGGCYGETHGAIYASVRTPDLVTVGPGVSVIADYDEPIFFSDGYYWWNYDGFWYQSPYYTRGWRYVASPPLAVARINRPWAFRHYRPSHFTVRNRPVPSRNIERPMVRTNRADRGRRR